MTEAQALRKPFLLGVLAVGIVILLLCGVIAVLASNTDDRPEGVAERWLTAVGDLTRKGVHDDAADRVRGHGDVPLGEQLLDGARADGKAAFTALEVGKARLDGDTAFVPAAFTVRGVDAERTQLLVLQRDAGSWRIVEVRPPDPTLKVPSDGGDVAAKAPVGLYAVALVIGIGIAAAASALVRAAGREHDEARSATA